MDFNFGNNDEPANPEEKNEFFSFNPDNNDADADNSVADDAATFDWTPDELQDSVEPESVFSEEPEQIPDDFINGDNADEEAVEDITDNANEEAVPVITDNADEAFDEIAVDVENDIVNNNSDECIDQQPSEDMFDDTSDETADSESDAFEDQPEAEAQEDDQMNGEEAQFEEDALVPPQPESAPLPAALNKKVRTPDGDQEYLLSELIDVETGEPLDLTSLIPEELLSGAEPAAAATSGFAFGAAEPAADGFDMSAEGESPAPSKKKRPARPKAEKKKHGMVRFIVEIILGGLLACIIFPYLMLFIQWAFNIESNFPMPAPGFPSTYKYIPEGWPEWAMFIFPGRTDSTDNPADNDADKPADKAAPKGAPKDAADAKAPEGEGDAQAPADAADQVDQPDQANDVAAAEDGDFDPNAFLGNEGEENNAQPADVPAEPVKPGFVNPPVYTSADVSDAVEKVGTAFKAAKATIDDAVYAALNEMAEKSTFVDTKKADATLKESMDKVKKAMGKFGMKDDLAAALADKWEARAEDESDNAGVMLVGTLKDASERNGYHVYNVEVQGKEGLTVEVVGLRTVKSAIGDKVVVCGKRIADPSKDLGGFNASLQPVIWGGIVIKPESK